jgi:hypothetical protein
MRWTPAQLTDLESFLEWIQGPSDLPHGPLQRRPTSKVRGPSVGKLPMVVVTNKARPRPRLFCRADFPLLVCRRLRNNRLGDCEDGSLLELHPVPHKLRAGTT